MQIKLITQGELEIMFKGETALSLGPLALLRYQINFLNDQSRFQKVRTRRIRIKTKVTCKCVPKLKVFLIARYVIDRIC